MKETEFFIENFDMKKLRFHQNICSVISDVKESNQTPKILYSLLSYEIFFVNKLKK